MKQKEIMKIAVERLDSVITEMNMTSSEIARMNFAAVGHDLVKIIKLAGEFDEEVKKENEDESW